MAIWLASERTRDTAKHIRRPEPMEMRLTLESSNHKDLLALLPSEGLRNWTGLYLRNLTALSKR